MIPRLVTPTSFALNACTRRRLSAKVSNASVGVLALVADKKNATPIHQYLFRSSPSGAQVIGQSFSASSDSGRICPPSTAIV
jgi:hypothetical protein